LKLEKNVVVTSATDLANFMGCRHATVLDKKSLVKQLEKPHYYNATREALKERGIEHEKHYLNYLQEHGLTGIELDSSSQEKVTAAMQEGAEYIYQAYLEEDGWRGYADFLIRVVVGRFSSSLYILSEKKSRSLPTAGLFIYRVMMQFRFESALVVIFTCSDYAFFGLWELHLLHFIRTTS